MIRRRATPDGLPFRVYERFGVRVYSIGYKRRSGVWAFRYECPVGNLAEIAKLRRKAILESANVQDDMPTGGFAGLVEAWFEWQEKLPVSSADKRADSTISENKREAANLKTAWGHLEPRDITKTMGYDYLGACVTAKRPEKGNKEMALAHLILEWGVRKNVLVENPLTKLRKNKVIRQRKLVTAQEMALAVEMGRKHGGARLIVALALKTAWLCVRRPVEVRGITRHAITDDGLVWTDGKDKTKAKVLIEWSDDLRATIEEAKRLKRNKDAGSLLLFGNMSGQRYTKGGWKAMLHDLMTACEEEAERRKMEFRKFNLQDCRPLGVSDKLDRGDLDTQNATGHTDGKMIARHYDRREIKRAKPAA
jgi:integrase